MGAARSVRIGTRGSALALAQTKLVEAALKDLGWTAEVVTIQTTGDQRQGTAEAKINDKREWIAELEAAVIEGRIDLAVHSGKDVPAQLDPRTKLVPLLTRANPLDLFVPHRGSATFAKLPENAVIGTSSIRRAAQLRALRPDLQIVEHRGNVPTRLAKLENHPELAGIVIAAAGVERLNVAPPDAELIPAELVVPAVNQGTLVAQLLASRADLIELLSGTADEATASCFWAERSCVETLGADCHSAVGTYASYQNGAVRLRCRVLIPDGSSCLEVVDNGDASDPIVLGRRVAGALLERGAAALLEQCRAV